MRVSIPASVAIISLLSVSVCFAQPKPRLDAYGQPLPDGAIARLGRLRFGLLGAPVAVAWSPNGRTIAAIDEDKPQLVIFEWPSGNRQREIPLKEAHSNLLMFSPDGKYLFWSDGYANREESHLWRVGDWSPIPLPLRLRKLGRAAAFSQDSKRLAFASGIEPIVEWTIEGKECKVFPGTAIPHASLQYAQNGQLIAALGENKQIIVKNLTTGQSLLKLNVDALNFRPIVFSPDGKWLAYQHNATTAIVSDLNGKHKRNIEIKRPEVWAQFKFSPDSRSLAVLLDNRLVFKELAPERVRFDRKNYAFINATISPNGKLFATFGPNHEHAVLFFDARTGERIETGVGHTSPVLTAFWTPDGKEIVTQAMRGDPRLHFWNPHTGKLNRTFQAFQTYGAVTWSSDHRWIVTTKFAPPDGKFRVWDISTHRLLYVFPYNLQFPLGYNASISSETQQVVAAGYGTNNDGGMLWDLVTGKKLLESPLGFHSVQSVEFLPGGDEFLMVANNALWIVRRDQHGLPTSREISQIQASRTWLTSDKRFAVVAGSDGNKKLRPRMIELATGKDVFEFGNPIQGFRIVVTRDLRTCALVGSDNKLRLLDLATSSVLAIFETSATYPRSFSPDDRLLLCRKQGLEAATPLIWDVGKWTYRKRTGINSATRTEVKNWCEQLRDPEASAGIRAAWKLADNPKLAVPALRDIFGESAKPDPTRIARLVSQLNDRKFAIRQAAERELITSGSVARDAIEQAIRTTASPEQLAQLKSLLTKIKEAAGSERVFASRSVLALEIAGTIEAKALLEDAAKRVPANRVAIEARRALRRWHDRP